MIPKLHAIPQRIISLVPSQTELLYDLGLEENIVGITKFCIHPHHFRTTKTIVGGTKKVSFEKILALQPDLIIANKEENTLKMVTELQKICPVWVTNIITIDDSLQMISDFGTTLGCQPKALEWHEKISEAYEDFRQFIENKSVKRVAYLIWKNPFMVAGSDNFINDMLTLNRFENSCNNGGRYPEMELEKIASNTEYIFLSSEPFPFSAKDVVEIESASKVKTVLVDGEMFSWYGSHILKAFSYFKRLHAELE